jgi:hypothetical protein
MGKIDRIPTRKEGSAIPRPRLQQKDLAVGDYLQFAGKKQGAEKNRHDVGKTMS